MAKKILIEVFVAIVFIYKLCIKTSSAATAVAKLKPAVVDKLANIDEHTFSAPLEENEYGKIMLLFTTNKVTRVSSNTVITKLNEFANDHSDMRTHADGAIANVQGMLPGGDVHLYVVHNDEQDGQQLKFMCMLTTSYKDQSTNQQVYDYVLSTYSYDDSRAVEPPLDGPNRINYEVCNELKAKLKAYVSSPDFYYFLEAAFVYHMEKYNIAKIDRDTNTLALL